MKLVECVPNVSEGRDRAVLDRCAKAITSIPGVNLLDMDPGADTHRTVFTFVGEPEPVLLAALALFDVTGDAIDMSTHAGAHPRQAAVDVCPFIPVTGVTMDDCVALSARLGEELGLRGYSVFLYERAARSPSRRNLADIRSGEYESLASKLGTDEWAPDFGPNAFTDRVRRSGAPIVGAREFLIAWNINVNTADKKLAHELALEIREKGRALRGQDAQIVKKDGQTVLAPTATSLPSVKAVGWTIQTPKYGPLAQVSINLCDYKTTPMWKVYDTARSVADRLGLVVTGSELVGLVPREALLEAGRHYRRRMGKSGGASESELMAMAVQSMGLSDLGPFDLDRKVLERAVSVDGPLVGRTVRGFVEETAADSPAPGGGSVSALAGAMGAALCAMVGHLTHSKKGLEALRPVMETLGTRAHELKEALLDAVDEDTRAFDAVMAATRLPKDSPQAIAARDATLESANRHAALVPLSVVLLASQLAALAEDAARDGNPACITDAGVAALLAESAARGARYNALVNLATIKDEAFVRDVRSRADQALERVVALVAAVNQRVETGLAGAGAGD